MQNNYPMPKKQRDTYMLAFDKIMAPGARDNHFKKIVTSLDKIIKGTNYEVAADSGLKPDQVWKRMSELVLAGTVMDTGLRGLSPDGNKAIIWALTKNKELFKDVEKPVDYREPKTTAADYASLLINSSKPLIQKEIFG